MTLLSRPPQYGHRDVDVDVDVDVDDESRGLRCRNQTELHSRAGNTTDEQNTIKENTKMERSTWLELFVKNENLSFFFEIRTIGLSYRDIS